MKMLVVLMMMMMLFMRTLDFLLMDIVLCVCSGPSMCAGVAGDAEQGCSAAAGRRSVDGALCEGHGSAGSGRSTRLYITVTSQG